jgi:hypothetical protein
MRRACDMAGIKPIILGPAGKGRPAPVWQQVG